MSQPLPKNPYPQGPLFDAWQRGIEERRLWSYPVDGCETAYREAKRIIRAIRARAAARDAQEKQLRTVLAEVGDSITSGEATTKGNT